MNLKFCKIIASIFFCLFIVTNPSVIATNDITVFVDNEQVIFDVQPRLIGGRTMVPLRAIFEKLGAEVLWEDATQTVTAYNELHIVKAIIGSNTITINNEEHAIDVAPMIINNRTLVPARFAAEALGCDVYWDSELKRVDIYTKDVDYSKVERESLNIPLESAENIYYPGTSIPTYTSIVGSPLIKEPLYNEETNAIIYSYNFTTTDNVSLYWETLLEYGWSIYDKETDKENFQQTVYFEKADKLISFTTTLKYNQIWIILID